MLDLGARFMDPALGRFMNPDPLSDLTHYQSPYAVADNNPVYHVDVHGLGILNVLKSLWKRIKHVVNRVVNPAVCDFGSGAESFADAWKRPDFINNKRGKKRRKSRKSKSSSSNTRTASNTGSSNSRSTVSGVNINSRGIAGFSSSIPTGDIIASNISSVNPPSIDGRIIAPGNAVSIPSELNFGGIHLRQGVNGSGTISRDVRLGNDAGTQRSLKQIAEVLLQDPKVKMRINFISPEKLTGFQLSAKNKQAITNWNKAKFQTLARYLQRDFGINPNRLYYSQDSNTVGGQLIFTKE